MNPILAVAALLALFTASLHTFWGSPRITKPLLASTLDARQKQILYAVWHMASVALTLSALALAFASLPGRGADTLVLVRFISLLWCAFGAVFLATILILADRSALLKLPQWVLLLPVGLLGFWGSVKPPQF